MSVGQESNTPTDRREFLATKKCKHQKGEDKTGKDREKKVKDREREERREREGRERGRKGGN